MWVGMHFNCGLAGQTINRFWHDATTGHTSGASSWGPGTNRGSSSGLTWSSETDIDIDQALGGID